MKTLKKLLKILLTFALPISSVYAQEAKSIHPVVVKDIDGNDVPLSVYKGKVLLVVNTASKCGFTSQYEGLEELYKTYKDKGFYVLAFPSNDFMGQEPGDNTEIKKFCKLNYNTEFPLFSKAPVSGENIQPLFKVLTTESGENSGRIKWNFEKFLVNKDGIVVDRWSSLTSPQSTDITSAIEKLL